MWMGWAMPSHHGRSAWRYLYILPITLLFFAHFSNVEAYADDFYSPELGAWVRLIKWRDDGPQGGQPSKTRSENNSSQKPSQQEQKRLFDRLSWANWLPWPDEYYAPAVQIIVLDDDSIFSKNISCNILTMKADDRYNIVPVDSADIEQQERQCRSFLPVRNGDIIIFNTEFRMNKSSQWPDPYVYNDGSIYKFSGQEFGATRLRNMEDVIAAVKRDYAREEHIKFSIARPNVDEKLGEVQFNGVSGSGISYTGRATYINTKDFRGYRFRLFKISNPWRDETERQAQENLARQEQARRERRAKENAPYDIIYGIAAVLAAGVANSILDGCRISVVDYYYPGPGERRNLGPTWVYEPPSCRDGYKYDHVNCVKTVRECSGGK